MELEWRIVQDHWDVPFFIEEFGRDPRLGFDFETTGLHYIRDSVHGMGVANQSKAWYLFDSALEAVLPWLKDKMEDPETETIGHNLKFDYHFLKQLDPSIKIATPLDTQIAQHLVDENSSLKLKVLAPRRLNLVDQVFPTFKDLQLITKKEKGFKRYDEVSIWDMDLDLVAEYGARDAWFAAKMWPGLYWDLVQSGQSDLFNMEMEFLEVLLYMERNGLFLHLDELYKLRKNWSGQLTKSINKWNEMTDEVNAQSNPQLQEWFYEELGLPITRTTKGGNASVDKISIQRLQHLDETGSAKLLLKIRKYSKLLGTYVNAWIEGMYNGYIYGNFNQTGTVTWRLSSSDPNLQNIPAHGELGSQLRLAIGAPPGDEMLVIDYSQIELRLVAAYAQVSSLLSLFKGGGDPHQLTADLVDVKRHIAKNLNFAWLYGAGPRKFCDMVEERGYPRPSEGEAKGWMKQFETAYPELIDFKDEVMQVGRRRGYVKTISGHRRHLPDLRSSNNSYRYRAERQAVNAVIQGSAGDLIKYAMLQIHPLLPDYGARMHIQVHDELVFTYPKEAKKPFVAMVTEKMLEVEQVFNLPVPILADANTAMKWGEAKHD